METVLCPLLLSDVAYTHMIHPKAVVGIPEKYLDISVNIRLLQNAIGFEAKR